MTVPGDFSAVRVEKLLVAGLRGFCAGVVRAIDVVEQALDVLEGPVYVRKEIIHNRYVVDQLREKGARFVEEVDEVPDNASLIFSAHGIAPQVRRTAMQKKLQTIDATCPLVTKVHLEAIHYAKQGYTIILVGHHDHDETVGTLGEAPDAIRLVETKEDAEKVTVPDPRPRGLPDADDALDRRHARDPRGSQAPVPEPRRAVEAGHLLRDAEPPGCRQGDGAARRHAARAGRSELFQLAAHVRGRARQRRRVLPHRAGPRHPAGVARRA